MNITTSSMIHKRFKCFVNYIAPEPEKRDSIKQKAENIRNCIKTKAEADGYTVLSAMNSGSFANKTGLRRSFAGDNEVEGQDIDLAFILEDKDEEGNPLQQCMVPTFKRYLDETWPNSETGETKSSATIHYSSDKLTFDTVPLFETNRPNIQLLLRTNNEKRQSSIQQHIEFVRSRTNSSNEIQGVVKFNECVRLVKWWRCYKQVQDKNNPFTNGIPSFLLILLCAHAYDEFSVSPTYPETLAHWFGCMADTVRNKRTVVFNDFISKHQIPKDQIWYVLDPMDDTNNIVRNWTEYKINALAKWLEEARDEMSRAIRYNQDGDDTASLNSLIKLFGNSISNQCKNPL